MSSSAPIETVSKLFCGPTTCSTALRNSSASRPCVTSTSPIILLMAPVIARSRAVRTAAQPLDAGVRSAGALSCRRDAALTSPNLRSARAILTHSQRPRQTNATMAAARASHRRPARTLPLRPASVSSGTLDAAQQFRFRFRQALDGVASDQPDQRDRPALCGSMRHRPRTEPADLDQPGDRRRRARRRGGRRAPTRKTWSSATSARETARAPGTRRSASSASVVLPAPGRRRAIRTPRSPSTTARWRGGWSRATTQPSAGSVTTKRAPRMSPGLRAGDVLGGQRAAMRLDDLAADRQAEAGILAERLARRPVGVEALEDAVDVVGRMPGPLSSTVTMMQLAGARQRDDDAAARPRARRSGHSRSGW